MKRNLTLCAVIAMMFAAMPVISSASAMQTYKSQEQQKPLQKSEGWIEIGEIEGYLNASHRCTCQLHVLELGDKLLYRVCYKGNYYAVTPVTNKENYNAKFKVNEIDYYLNVPSW